MGSTLGALKAACLKLNLSQSGSKRRCLDRLRGHMQKQQLMAECEIAESTKEVSERPPRAQFVPEVPSQEERLLHEVTHLPYKAWCPHCTMMKAVPDQHRSLPEGVREYPTISFDMSYTGYECTNEPAESEKDKLACLIVHCSHTDAIAAVPLPDKSAPSMKHAAVEVVCFCQLLGHTEVELKCDNEPSMLLLQGLALNARKRLGFKTRIKNPPVGAHQANGQVEKSVDVIRSLANVMLSMARERLGIEIGVKHPLFSWAFVHSAWCYSRYHVKAGLTAHERASRARYNGKLVPFAEPGYAYVKPLQKENPKWEMSIFLSKSSTSDMFIVGTAQGIRLTKSVRRTGQPWKVEHKLAESLKGLSLRHTRV